ncbi:SDR family NAD(P)-dependent oxidoreductase [Streptomyces griseorubiginosus]|uniref:SDR family NAD(P)-dependent oxidoreductase n=1 Tax=Streptomyces griseorubiginosus TaxID=67304 RepID=UPI001AD7C14C|nr:SDR family NAD(P)-dependent oxidoreductase [Streptomyces griseorubiginosus]MBO4256945.1 SDR family NAD(P)-dependent oxidoreductase [Streptomyces griseorubiginosus]
MAILKDKVAIVTGGGRGIGRAHALALADEGAAVIVNDLGAQFSGDGDSDSGPAQDVVNEIVAAGGHAVADTTDISDWDDAGTLVHTALEAFGRVDIIVNNAGISRFGTIDTISRRDWERTVAVNLTGTAALCHWAAAHWRKEGPQPGRSIVNTSSGVGLVPWPGNPMYAAAKAGVAALTITCAMELAELGVRVNAVAPAARSRISETVAPELMKSVEDGFDRMAPENVAAIVAYLASPLCRFTGRVFGVIGDDLTIYDGWTVSRHFNNAEQRWSPETLQTALADVPLQQQVTQQGVTGMEQAPSPPQEVLAALTAVEKA